MKRTQSHWNASFNATCLVLLRDAELQVGTSRASRLPSSPLPHPRESRKASLLVRTPLASLTHNSHQWKQSSCTKRCPVVGRNVNELAIFDMAQQDDALALADRGFTVPVAGGSTLLAVYSANASAVVLAFAGTNETLANVTSSNPLEDPAFFKGAFSEQGNGSVDPVLVDPFAGRVGSGHEGLYWVRRWLHFHHTWLGVRDPVAKSAATVAPFQNILMSMLWQSVCCQVS